MTSGRSSLKPSSAVRQRLINGTQTWAVGELAIVMVVVEELLEHVQGAFESAGLRAGDVLRQICSLDLLDRAPLKRDEEVSVDVFVIIL